MVTVVSGDNIAERFRKGDGDGSLATQGPSTSLFAPVKSLRRIWWYTTRIARLMLQSSVASLKQTLFYHSCHQ